MLVRLSDVHVDLLRRSNFSLVFYHFVFVILVRLVLRLPWMHLSRHGLVSGGTSQALSLNCKVVLVRIGCSCDDSTLNSILIIPCRIAFAAHRSENANCWLLLPCHSEMTCFSIHLNRLGHRLLKSSLLASVHAVVSILPLDALNELICLALLLVLDLLFVGQLNGHLGVLAHTSAWRRLAQRGLPHVRGLLAVGLLSHLFVAHRRSARWWL